MDMPALSEGCLPPVLAVPAFGAIGCRLVDAPTPQVQTGTAKSGV
jgi:hypothetical protein